MKDKNFQNVNRGYSMFRAPVKLFFFFGFFVWQLLFLYAFDAIAGANRFTQTVLPYYFTTIYPEDIQHLAKYDVIILNRFNYRDVDGDTWAAIKAINPNIEIYLYQQGQESNEAQDNLATVSLNNIARYKNSRGHSMGALYTNHPDLFLLDTNGNRIAAPTNTRWKMDHGASRFQNYWLEATITDIVNQPWKVDGVFGDGFGAYNSTGTTSQKYPTMDLWNPAMNSFITTVTKGLHARNQKFFPNRCASNRPEGYEAWIALDSLAHPPDIVMEEGAFAVLFGPNDVQFFGEVAWKRQVDVLSQLNNSRVAVLSHTELTPKNAYGIDNHGKTASYWQVLWYSMASYHLGRRDNPNNAYFMFSSNVHYKDLWWFDAYDRIDLGRALGKYSVREVGDTRVYFREFEKGYIFVNPTPRGAKAVSLPVPGVRLTHENINSDFSTLPEVSSIDVLAHHGEIIFLPGKISPPDNLRIVEP